jgi:2-furoate---CoA ligase
MHTTYDLVWYAAERTPDHLAIVDDRTDRRLTYRELMAEVDTIAAGLKARGIKRGSRFGTVLPNLFEHCLMILALARLGAVPALINARLTADEIAQLVKQADLDGAIIMPSVEVAKAVVAVLPRDAPLLCATGKLDNVDDFTGCRGDAAKLAPFVKPEPEELAYIFYTSGTTGLPKGVEIPHRTTEPRIIWISPNAGLRCGTHNRILGLAPLSHAIGLYGNFLAALTHNATYFVVSQFDPAKVVVAIAEHRITYLFTVPTFYAAMTQAPNYAPEKMASLELVLYGGAAIPPPLLDRISSEWPARFCHIYGTTETMCSLYFPEPAGQPTRLRPGYYSRIRVIGFGGGPDDRVAPGEEGELIADANSDQVFTGYLNRPDVTAEKVRDGWYYTGDVVRLREDGDVELVGRVDDVIRSGGENIHPEDIEDILNTHEGVREISVVGAKDPYWGEMTVACVVPGDPPPRAEELDAFCRASPLASYKRPRGYVFLDALPKNTANKVLRRVLRKMATEARDAQTADDSQAPLFHEIGSRK